MSSNGKFVHVSSLYKLFSTDTKYSFLLKNPVAIGNVYKIKLSLYCLYYVSWKRSTYPIIWLTIVMLGYNKEN